MIHIFSNNLNNLQRQRGLKAYAAFKFSIILSLSSNYFGGFVAICANILTFHEIQCISSSSSIFIILFCKCCLKIGAMNRCDFPFVIARKKENHLRVKWILRLLVVPFTEQCMHPNML